MVEAAPSASLEVPQPKLLLELLIIALNAPAQFGEIDHAIECGIGGQRREPIFGRFGLVLRPFDQQPFLRPRITALIVTMGDTNADPRKARAERFSRAFAPFDPAPRAPGESKCKLLDRDRLMLAIAA
jgi:hypothetical protein